MSLLTTCAFVDVVDAYKRNKTKDKAMMAIPTMNEYVTTESSGS